MRLCILRLFRIIYVAIIISIAAGLVRVAKIIRRKFSPKTCVLFFLFCKDGVT